MAIASGARVVLCSGLNGVPKVAVTSMFADLMPKLSPAPAPDYTSPEDDNDALSHIIGISVDSYGFPIGLFTTNRWICAETWYRAEDVCTMVDFFSIDHARPSWPLNRWVTAMLKLFKPQITELLLERDETVAAWQKKHPKRNVYEDRDLDITSRIDITPEVHISQLDAALETVERRGSALC